MHWVSCGGHAVVVQTLLQHGADVSATNKLGAAGVPQALTWWCARECLHAMCVCAMVCMEMHISMRGVRASACMPCVCAPWYAWRCVHAIVCVCVAVPGQQRAAR